MTDPFSTVDAVLWSLAVALTVAAVWLALPRRATWDVAVFFASVWAALRRPAPLPLEEGPVPAAGWPETPPEEAYDPARRIGPRVGWAALAARDPAVEETLRRRLAHVHLVWFEPPVVDLGEVHLLPEPAAAHDALEALVAPASARLVLLASERSQELLVLLHELQGLRDRVLLVIFVGPHFDAEWVAREFRHPAFDLELAREIPYCTLRTGPGQVLRSPPPVPTERTSIAVVDLGRVDPARLGDPDLGLALRATVAAVVFS